MSTSIYPSGYDAFIDPPRPSEPGIPGTLLSFDHIDAHLQLIDAVKALQTHVGSDGETAPASVEQRLVGVIAVADAAASAAADAAAGAISAIAAAALVSSDLADHEADLGTAAFLNVGTVAGDLVQVQAGGALPALDASALLNLPASGVTDHGALTGLADDDHTQYHTDARGDARYAPIAKGVTGGDSHNHDGGDGAQIAYASLSGLPTLGSAAAAATGDFEPSGAVSTHNAVATAHGISAWGATLVDDADANTARSTLGLGSVDNTSDASKPVSTAQQTALNLKANLASPTFTGTVGGITAAMVGAPSGSGNSTGTNTGNETTTTVGALLNAATSKTTPADADHIGLMDSEASNIWNKLSWANLKTTLLGGSPVTDFFKHGSVVMNTNAFGGRKLFINSINNALFRAESRWVVTGNLFLTADDSLVGAISAASLATLFDGSYDTYLTVPVGNYAVINISFSTESGGNYPGYPYGYLYISHYFDRYSSSTRTSTLSVYCNYAPHGIGWHTTSFGGFFSGTNQKIDSARQSKYDVSQFELKIYAPDSGASAQITQVDLNLDRPGSNEMPVVDKFKPNKLYAKLSTETLTPRVAGTYDLGESGTPYRRLFLRHTTEQLRVEYDAANYWRVTVSSAGIPTFNATGNAFVFNGDIRLDKTVTAGGTTGAQTINKPIGSVNFAAGASSLVVTNSLVTTSSVITATVGTNDATMKSVAVVAAAGSFTLHANAAATAETRVNFHVFN